MGTMPSHLLTRDRLAASTVCFFVAVLLYPHLPPYRTWALYTVYLLLWCATQSPSPSHNVGKVHHVPVCDVLADDTVLKTLNSITPAFSVPCTIPYRRFTLSQCLRPPDDRDRHTVALCFVCTPFFRRLLPRENLLKIVPADQPVRKHRILLSV